VFVGRVTRFKIVRVLDDPHEVELIVLDGPGASDEVCTHRRTALLDRCLIKYVTENAITGHSLVQYNPLSGKVLMYERDKVFYKWSIHNSVEEAQGVA